MKNPAEKDGYVMIFTTQDKRSLDILKKEGRFINKLSYARAHFGDIYDFFKEKYTYFVDQAEKMVPKPNDVDLPIWCSVSADFCLRPSEGSVAYALKVPTDKVIYFDGSKWDYVLNNHYVPVDDDDLKEYKEYIKDNNLPNAFLIATDAYKYLYPEEIKKIEKSYKRIFDISEWNIYSIQANIWEITEDMVIKVFHPGDEFDINEYDLEKYL